MAKKASSSMSDQIMDYVRSDYFKRIAVVTGVFLLSAVVVYYMTQRSRPVTGDGDDPAPAPHPAPHNADQASDTDGAHEKADKADRAHGADEKRAVVADRHGEHSKSQTLIMRTR